MGSWFLNIWKKTGQRQKLKELIWNLTKKWEPFVIQAEQRLRMILTAAWNQMQHTTAGTGKAAVPNNLQKQVSDENDDTIIFSEMAANVVCKNWRSIFKMSGW